MTKTKINGDHQAGVIKAMTPTDKYAERARGLCPLNTAFEHCVECQRIARALEQAALGARIQERAETRAVWIAKRDIDDYNVGTDELRARLAKLEGKDAKG